MLISKPNRSTVHQKRRELIADFCRENSVQEATTEFHVSDPVIRRICREYGVRPPTGRTTQEGSSLRILKRLMDGERQCEIAKDLGISRQRVHEVKKQALEAGFRW